MSTDEWDRMIALTGREVRKAVLACAEIDLQSPDALDKIADAAASAARGVVSTTQSDRKRRGLLN